MRVGSTTFQKDLDGVMAGDATCYLQARGQNGRDAGKRPDSTMTGIPEPLIAKYGLEKWRNPIYNGRDPLKISMPVHNDKYYSCLIGRSTSTSLGND